MTTEHEFTVSTGRCRWCGTRREHHEANAQNCVPRWESGEKKRPEPVLREIACEDATTIAARIAELRAERDKVRAEPAIDHGDCCY